MVKKENKKIVVIGSNSFSAGSLINLLLQKNYNVYGMSRSMLNKKSFLRFSQKNKNFHFYKFDVNKDGFYHIGVANNLDIFTSLENRIKITSIGYGKNPQILR